MPFLGIPTSRKDVGNAGWLKGAATTGARTLANVAQVLPGQSPAGVQKARNFADAVDNPNQGYSGSLNPWGVFNQIDDKGTAFSTGAPRSVSPQVGQVQGAETFDPSMGMGAGGVYTGDPSLNPATIAMQKDKVRSLLQTFQAAFDDVFSKVDTLASQKRGEFEQNYAGQQEGLDKNYGTTSTGIDDQYSARNAYHSSYRDNAQAQAKDAYDTATMGLGQARDKDLASVGQFAEQQKAELNGSRPTFNVDDYTDANDLISIGQDVQAALARIQQTGAGLGTDSQYLSKLNSIAPTQEAGSAALKAQLDKLVNVGTNPDAKRAIAMTTIANSGGDQSAWMDYFEKQMNQTGSGAVVDPTMTQLQ